MTPHPPSATIRPRRNAHAEPQRARSRSVFAADIVSTASPAGSDHRADRSGSADGPSALVGSDRRADRTLSWNSLYQLTSVSTNGVPAESYTYDALGRRISTTTTEGTLFHVYDDNWQCLADVNGQGDVVASYVWGPGIDNLLSVNVADGGGHVQTYYALTDHQNTVHGFADTNGTVVVRSAYDAWGNLLSEECSVPALASNRYRFQGREWSAATGLTNFRARWYDPETGRWLSKDPIGLAGGLNLYAFCGIEPNGTDVAAIAISPLMPMVPDIGIGLGEATGVAESLTTAPVALCAANARREREQRRAQDFRKQPKKPQKKKHHGIVIAIPDDEEDSSCN